MRNILVSDAVWEAIANRGKFGETEDDVLRREFKLPPNPKSSNGHPGPDLSRIASKRASSGPRQRIATRRMSAYVGGNQLYISFQDGPACSWALPSPNDKAAIREVRDKAVAFALENGASYGQKLAVMKALTAEGFYVSK